MIYSGHQGYLDDIAVTVREVEQALRPHKQRFDFIAVTGMSGALIGSPAAIRLRKPLVVLRKDDDHHHDGNDVINAAMANGRYLIIDDFISLGTTFDRIRQRFDKFEFAVHTRYAGAYLYSDRLLSWDGDGLIAYKPKPERENSTYAIDVDAFDRAPEPKSAEEIKAGLRVSFEKLKDDLDTLGKAKAWTDVFTSQVRGTDRQYRFPAT